MLAARQFDYFAEEHSDERKTRFFNSAARDTSLEFYQQFLPATMNQLKSPRNRVDYNRHFMQLTNKPRKQEDQHFTPRRLTNTRKARSFSSPSPERFLRHFSPGKLSQQYPNNNLPGHSILNQADPSFLYQSPRLYNQNTMCAGSLGSTGDSRPGSSDDSLANRSSPIRQLDTSSPDDFEYFRMFEDASVPDVSGLSFSSVANRSENCQADCERFEDLNMNFLKIDLLDVNDNYSIPQSPEQPIHSSNAQRDVSSVPLMTLATKELEITQDMGQDTYSEQKSPEQRTHSPKLQRDVPLIPLIPKELEIANEMEKDDDTGTLRSPVRDQCSSSIQRDVPSVPLIAKELEVAKETEIATEIEKNQSLDYLKGTLPYHCSKHPYTQLLYCQTCCKPICKECAAYCTSKHVTVDLVEFIETAQRQAEEVLIEAYLGIDVLADDMENMGLDIAALDQRTREALSDVKFFSRRMWSAVEEREKKLFKQIVEARRWKFEVLHERYMHLKEDKSRLSQAVSALKYAIYDARFPNLACNPDDLLKRKDMVVAEIWQIRQNRKMKTRATREENWISFKSSDSNVLAVIANGGNVLLNSPGTIGDRLPSNRDYKLLQSQYFPYGLNEQMMQPIPRGRPIVNYERNIVLPNRKAELQVKSTDVRIIGHFGENNAENLCRPWGLTCDNEGNIIVSDRSNNRIQIYRDDGTLVRKFGSYGNGPCQFNRPAGIAVDARRRLIVVDKDNHRIQILTMEGEFLRSFGEHGEKQGQFCYPWDVAVNTACEIAVTDTRNHRVQLFSAEGIPLRMFGGQPHLLRYLDSPRGICFNQEGKLIVTDFNNHHVLIIEYNMTDMRILKCEKELKGKRQDGSGENGDGQSEENAPAFQRPQGVIVADDGSILVADSRHNSIKAFNSVGSLIYSYKPGQEEMDRPLGVALHWDGRMAFTDYGRNYVRLVRLEHHVDPVSRNAIMFG